LSFSTAGSSTPSCRAIRDNSQSAVIPEWMITSSADSYSSSGNSSSIRRASVVLPVPRSPISTASPFIVSTAYCNRISARWCCALL
jgi:hypothetical protein